MVPLDDAQLSNTSNIRVIARVRPPCAPEKPGCIACPLDNTLELVSQDGSSLHFTFDKVHGLPNGAGNTPADIFSDVQDIVLSTLEGLNGCVVAYGLTGKTYTLFSDDSSTNGIFARSLDHLAEGISEITDGSQCQVYLSVVDIQYANIEDILSSSPDSTCLAVQQAKELKVNIADTVKVAVDSEIMLLDLTRQSLARRMVADAGMQATRDRSHCLITLTVRRHLPDGSVMRGKLTFARLPGFEEQDRTLALASALQEVLGMDARMAVIVCCSPAASDAAETLSALCFGNRAKAIMTRMQVPAARRAAAAGRSEEALTAGIERLMKLHEDTVKLHKDTAKLKAETIKLAEEAKRDHEAARTIVEEMADVMAEADAPRHALGLPLAALNWTERLTLWKRMILEAAVPSLFTNVMYRLLREWLGPIQ